MPQKAGHFSACPHPSWGDPFHRLASIVTKQHCFPHTFPCGEDKVFRFQTTLPPDVLNRVKNPSLITLEMYTKNTGKLMEKVPKCAVGMEQSHRAETPADNEKVAMQVLVFIFA